MTWITGLIAAAPSPLDKLPPPGGGDSLSNPIWRDVFSITLLALGLGLVIALFCLVITRRRRGELLRSRNEGGNFSRKRSRNRRYRHRNPTLAETGGLPPIKDKPSDSASS